MRSACFAIAAALVCAPPAFAQDAKKEIQKYQQMIADGTPVELFELEGEALWKKPQGPKNVSLEKCDLGQGAGVLKGAYARLPRYFKDADRVMDLETRLLHCMTTLQGRSREEATKRVFGNDDQPSEMEYLSAYVAGAVARREDGAPAPRTRRRRKPTSSARRCSSTAPAPGTSPAPAATARKASASACRTCRCCPSRSSRGRSSPPGPPTACRTASSRPCSGASTTATGRCACPSRSSPPRRPSR